MKITIVTISFNQATYLHRCIDSVITQNYSDVEYIVVDPGSTDGSRAIIQSYGQRLLPVFEEDAGPADGLNKGFARARGDVLGFLNADDELLPGALRRVAEHFLSRPDVDVVSGCGYSVDADGRRQGRIVPSRFTPWLCAHGAVTVFQQGTFFRRASFENTAGFNLENRIAWDGELFLDMALNGVRFARISDDLALFRVHPDSITGGGGHGSGNLAYREFRDRIFIKATGRDRGRIDFVLDGVARVVKYASDPMCLARRVTAAVDLNVRSRRPRGAGRDQR
jgi:glycosyltransferase involved in cell wall biosynthesis